MLFLFFKFFGVVVYLKFPYIKTIINLCNLYWLVVWFYFYIINFVLKCVHIHGIIKLLKFSLNLTLLYKDENFIVVCINIHKFRLKYFLNLVKSCFKLTERIKQNVYKNYVNHINKKVKRKHQ